MSDLKPHAAAPSHRQRNGPGVRDPDGVLEFTDATWQDNPTWRPGDTWVAYWGPSLIADAPPFPGVAVRTLNAKIHPGSTLRIEVTQERPRATLRKVAATTLWVGGAGMHLAAGTTYLGVPLAAGIYPCEVWVDASEPSQVGHAHPMT